MSQALVPMKDLGCPECQGPLIVRTVWERALVRGGGYGATRKTTIEVCFGCRWSRVGEVQEVSPRAGPA